MTEDPPNATSRRDKRVGTVLRVQYRNTGQFLVSYCTNLSRGGLFVTTSEPTTRAGQLITLSIEVPGLDEPAELSARVCWTRPTSDEFGPSGMGLRFEEVDNVLGEHIDTLVSKMKALSIVLVGRTESGWSHMSSLLSTMIFSELSYYRNPRGTEPEIKAADLVIIDLGNDTKHNVEFIEKLALVPKAPPVLALCDTKAQDLVVRSGRVAQVVTTPVDNATLQARILHALGQVKGSRQI